MGAMKLKSMQVFHRTFSKTYGECGEIYVFL